MTQEAKTAQPGPSTADIGIRLEDGADAHHQHHSRQWLPGETKAEGCAVREHMKPEDAEEEGAEGVEHFREEVPPEAAIRGEVWEL